MDNKLIPVGLLGAGGRMGLQVQEALLADQRFLLTGLQEARDSALIGQEIVTPQQRHIRYTADPSEAFEEAHIIIDFSLPQGTVSILPYACAKKIALVSGTTGFSDTQLDLIKQAADTIPIVLASNMSLGLNLLQGLIKVLVGHLPRDYDIEVLERHHRHKRDSPSGTAREIAGLIRRIQGKGQESPFQCGRPEGFAERNPDDLVVHALRGGGIIGEHQVQAIGEAEEIILTHRAFNRQVFVQGALAAALFVASATPGQYSMHDVLGFTEKG